MTDVLLPGPDMEPPAPSKESPPDVTSSYHSVIQRAAEYHKLPIHTTEEETDFLVETLSHVMQYLPMMGYV